MDALNAESVLGKFLIAMESVYGPLSGLDDVGASEWMPPSTPGAGGHRGRYLWTDAVGVLNFLTLYKETASLKYLQLAKRLIETTHAILGWSRNGQRRLRGATKAKPLKGGLRIGKMTDNGPDGDGQYHHYLTLWMFALNRMTCATDDPRYNSLAVELAKAVHPNFVFRDHANKLRMVWKVSVDMNEILVPTQGRLDAATGYVIYRILQDTEAMFDRGPMLLEREIEDYSVLTADTRELTPTTDFLDLGMSLWLCHLIPNEDWASKFARQALRIAKELLGKTSAAAKNSSRRLAFREFGSCLGVKCYDVDEELRNSAEATIHYWESVVEEEDEDLRPITQVMYASALIPGGT